MSLTGVDGLVRRLEALRGVSVVVGRRWQEATVPEMQRRIPVRTGRTRQSVHAGPRSTQSASVRGSYVTNFIEAGTAQHTETPRDGKALKFQVGGRTYFRRRVVKPRVPGHPFKREAARIGLAKADPSGAIVELWNRSA